eukprot:EG_transcript_16639
MLLAHRVARHCRPGAAGRPFARRWASLTPVVLDFECTTEVEPREITEVGAVLLEPKTLAPLREFQAYVRPVHNPILSEHCRSVTGVEQATIDAAQPFPQVWCDFLEWLETPYDHVVLCGWGPFEWWWLRDECRAKGLPQPLHRYVDAMAEAAQHLGHRGLGDGGAFVRLPTAAGLLQLPVDLTQLHGALYDARLTAQVLQRVMDPTSLPGDLHHVLAAARRAHPNPLGPEQLLEHLQREPTAAAAAERATRYQRKTDRRWWELWFAELARLGLATAGGQHVRLRDGPPVPLGFANSAVALQPKLLGRTQELGSRHRQPKQSRVPRPTLGDRDHFAA